MLRYRQFDNTKSVEITVKGRVSLQEFERVAAKLDAFIARHGTIDVLEIIESFDGMDARAFWRDLRFSLHHLRDFGRCAVVSDAKLVDLWSELIAPFTGCEVRYFKPEQIAAARSWLGTTEDASPDIAAASAARRRP
jgi:SpoIIAA-like